jgi:hypothetical protein
MADFSCASTKRRPTGASLSWSHCLSSPAAMPIRRSIPRRGQPSQVFAGHYVDYNPYDPISYAQNNTGRGGGR